MTSDDTGIPIRALEGYRLAVSLIDTADPDCNIDWALLAAIGSVESNHARFGGNQLDSAGVAQPGIIGIPLNGSNGTARITDSDGGLLDRDNVFDRAVGPMQFIPSTWRIAGTDADGDGASNPQNMADAAAASAIYLCSGPGDLSQPGDLRAAIMRYNASDSYARTVTSIASAYRLGVVALPASDLPASDLTRSDLPRSDRPATSSAFTSVAAAPAQTIKALPTSAARRSSSAPTTLSSVRRRAATPQANPRPSTSVTAKPTSVTPKTPTPATSNRTPAPATSTPTRTSLPTPTQKSTRTPAPATSTPTRTSNPAPSQSPSPATPTQSPRPATPTPTPTPCVPETDDDDRPSLRDDNSGRDNSGRDNSGGDNSGRDNSGRDPRKC